MRLAALLRLVRYLGEASGDTGLLKRPCEAVASVEASVAPVWRRRFQAHRAAFEHRLQPVDAAIALSQTLGPAEAVARAVAHAELFEAESTAWCIVDEPKPFGPSAAFWANKVAPRAAVREPCMGEADELLFVTEGDDALAVLKPDHARGAEAGYADAHKLIEENAAVRVASAFRHELEAALRIRLKVRYHITTPFPRRLLPEANGDRVCCQSNPSNRRSRSALRFSSTARELVPGCGSPTQRRTRAGRPASARS
jgi:hypothetical protein